MKFYYHNMTNIDICVVAVMGQTDCGVVNVVVGGNHAQVEGCDIHLVLNADTFRLLQIMQRVFHQLRQVV